MKNLKALLIPLAVLVILFAICFSNSMFIDRQVNSLLSELEQCDESAIDGQWAQAEDILLSAQQTWVTSNEYLCLVLDHADTELVSTLFNKAISYLRSGDLEDFRSALSELRSELFIIAETEEFTLQNLF